MAPTVVKPMSGTPLPSTTQSNALFSPPLLTRSGQNLYCQYANKKSKAVLDARWIRECIKVAALQTFATNWAGCNLDGTETQIQETPSPRTSARQVEQQQQQQSQQQPIQQRTTLHIDPQTDYAFVVYIPPSWLRPRLRPRPNSPGRLPLLPCHHLKPLLCARSSRQPAPAQYDYTRSYRDEENGWAAAAPAYYEPAYVPPYQSTYRDEDHTTPEAGPSTLPVETPEKPRGRKRVRASARPVAVGASYIFM
ncbi:hypothetical protein B0H13DRAFT_2367164 [Mycena leptocephala]|nr:hypothetical protein B0H13DRAFT_2367164 [Mycena leptocephala]